jgi:thiol-disulfide isomerase/thioredoxin
LRLSPILAAVVSFAILDVAVAHAEDAGAPDLWRHALAFQATVRDSAPSNADVFTSGDHHSLLVFPGTGVRAYIFRIESNEVAVVPLAAVEVQEEGIVVPPDTKEPVIGTFTREGAHMHFASGGLDVTIEPAEDLVGEVTLAEIEARRPMLRRLADAYRPDSTAVETLRRFGPQAEILAFFGTWCPVCARRLPLFVKTLEAANNPRIRVRYIAIAEDYTQPAELIKEYRVRITPTFVVLVGGREAGRIQAAPHPSLEQALADIFASAR